MTQPPSGPETEARARGAVLNMVSGFMYTQAIRSAVDLGIADLVAGGPKPVNDLAAATKAHEPSLARLLRALAAFGVLTEEEPGRFGPTPRSDLLRRDHPRSLRPAALYFGKPWIQDPWRDLTYAVQTGRSAFEHVHGADYWQYLADHQDEAAVFNELLALLRPQRHAAVVEAYEFADMRTLVDIGGGYGQLLVAVLKAHPEMRGVLFDLPSVVTGARATLEEGGVAGRCEVVGGDMFAAVPAGGDAYVLSNVIHDWGDEASAAILASCHRAMNGRGILLLVEQLAVPGQMQPSVAAADLHMLTMFTEARQRSEPEFQALLQRTAFRLMRIIPTKSDASIVEATPL